MCVNKMCIHVCVYVYTHLLVCVCRRCDLCALACIWVGSRQTNACVRGWGCCLNSKHDNPQFPFFFRSFPFSSPKIGCTPFVTSHECLLNLLWRDLGVNLFPVEKAKLWNHEPKNKSRVTLGKPFMVLVRNVFV